MHPPAHILQPVRAAIIDLDGTMVDTAPDFLCALNAMRSQMFPVAGLAPLQLETVKNMVGKGSENLIRSTLALDFAPQQVDQWTAAALACYLDLYRDINGRYSSVYPDVRAGLEALAARGMRLACVTNKPRDYAVALLQHFDLLGFFAVVFGGDSFSRKKPDPMPMLKACEWLGLAPQQVLAVGDSENDAQAARAAGCPVLLVTYGYNHGRDLQTVASDGMVSGILEAAQRVDKQFAS